MTARTGPDSGILGELRTIVLPLRGVTVHGPALAELRDGEPIKKLTGGAVDMRVALGMGIKW